MWIVGEQLDLAADLAVRTMQAEDAEAVALLVEQLGYPRNSEQIREWIGRSAGTGQQQTCFVACLEDDVVGWVEVSIVWPLQRAPHGLIGGLVVKEGVRGMGIGRRLRERAEVWAWDHGVDEMVVTSRSTRADAHRFYLRDGYARVKTSEVFGKRRQG